MTEDAAYGDDVYTAGVEDAEDPDPLESLTGEDAEEPLDTGYSPPEHRPAATRYGTTAAEQEQGESLDQRLAQEVPDLDPQADPEAESPRAGRLVAPDEGAHPDDESDSIAFDVGKAGSAASAEEAAMHIVDEDELNEQDTNEDDLGN
ncbi:MAG: DUF5709 domain-containing protein [Actinomycetota bacterium]|nr:DUF5709 domain-containing protein [Actinomycetota bacterium]